MKILVGNKKGVDFDGPVEMTEKQKEAFLDFLRNTFAVIEVEYDDDIREARIGDKLPSRSWSIAEYGILLETEGTDRVAEKLGRSWMSVNMKRGFFYPEFLAWTAKNGKNILKDNTEELIKEFIKTKQDLIKSRKQKKKELNKMENELKKMKAREQNQEWKMLVKIKMISKEDIEAFSQRKAELEANIEELQKEMGEEE